MAISERPLRIEYWPVISAARDGVQAGSTRNWVSRSPSLASWSMRGVGAPRSFAAAVGAQVAVADVIGENENDIRVSAAAHQRALWSRSRRVPMRRLALCRPEAFGGDSVRFYCHRPSGCS